MFCVVLTFACVICWLVWIELTCGLVGLVVLLCCSIGVWLLCFVWLVGLVIVEFVGDCYLFAVVYLLIWFSFVWSWGLVWIFVGCVVWGW